MSPRFEQWRRSGVRILILVLTAVGLGVVAAPSAAGSCVGPQVALHQGGAPVPSRWVGVGDDERLRYDVSRAQPLEVQGTNLTYSCQDTYSTTRFGCGPLVPDPVEPLVPMSASDLVVTQGGRSWTLATVDGIGPDLAAQVDVQLPAELRPGPATLSLQEWPNRADAGVRLELAVS